MKHAGRKVGASVVVASALVLCVGVGSAFAGAQDTAGKDTNWTVPTQAMTNTVELNDGNTYKVITTWANAWATGGPDYLGISNSCYLATQGGGTSSADSLQYAQQSTLLGIWASVANENPNAYNWNTFYNLYVDTDAGYEAGATAADFETTNNTWNSKTGVWGAFDFRPEIIWTSNGLSDSAVGTYVGYINNGQYFSGTDIEAGQSGTPGTDDYNAPDTSEYYIDGDESYNPYVISANNQNAYSYTDTFYNLAGFVDEIIEDYSEYDGKTSPQTDWKGMNALPRTTRYETVGLSAQDCALNIERVTRGSIYYVLEQINEGNVDKKKVAYLESAPNTSSSSVTVIAYDYIENVGQGPNNGYASYSPTIVDQLITDQNVTQRVIANESTVGANSSSYNNDAKGSALYGTESTATADDLLDCDIIYVPNGSMNSSEVSEWLSNQATSADKETKLEAVEISAYAPAIMQWSNFTAEKMVYGTYAVNFFYPECFPNMELVGYWYDEVYHMNTDAITTAMGYTFGNADLPKDTQLADLGDSYSKDDMETKFAEGLEYYANNFETDATISRILTGKALPEGVTTQSLTFNGFNPSNEFLLSVLTPTEVVEYLAEYGDFINSSLRDTKNDEIDALEQAVKDLEESLENAETDLENANGTITDLEGQLSDLQSSDNAKQEEIDRLAKEIEDLNKQLEEAKKGSTANNGSGTGTGSKAAAAQKITAKKSVKAKKGKKTTIKVSGAKTALKVTAKGKAKKALKVTVKKGKIVVKAKKKGTYKVQVYAAASSSYAKSNTVTIKVKVK